MNERRRESRNPASCKRNPKILALISGLILTIAPTGILLARREPPAQGEIQPAGLQAASPSKEYVFAGGRLVATEEPAGTSCSYTLSESIRDFASTGGSGTVNVTTGAGCGWAATSNVEWLTSNSSGSGSGVVNYNVAANFAYGCRDGKLAVADQFLTVREAGSAADSDCDGIPNSVEPAEGTNPNFKDNDVFTSARLFVMQQYRDFLSREGDSGGITFWANQITSGAMTRAQVTNSFIVSTEHQNTAGAMARLYFASFERRPDYSGFQFWLASLRAGTPLASIAQSFVTSGEFINKYGNLNNSNYVIRVFLNTLGVPPSQSELDFWTGQLDSGAQTRGQVMLNFSEGTEFKASSSNKVYISLAYAGMVRRGLSQADFDFWLGQLNGGASPLNLINSLLNSTEYSVRFLP